jgi:hypothetical protein
MKAISKIIRAILLSVLPVAFSLFLAVVAAAITLTIVAYDWLAQPVIAYDGSSLLETLDYNPSSMLCAHDNPTCGSVGVLSVASQKLIIVSNFPL